jgi:DNA polymerase III epsilon subunit-like protein
MNTFLHNEQLPYLKTLSQILQRPLTFVDLEATGLVHDPYFSIIEIGIVTITPDKIEEKSALIDPNMSIPPFITQITGITNAMVKGQKKFAHFNQYFNQIANNHILCGYNSKAYDSSGICKMARKHNSFYTFKNQLDFRYIFLRSRNSLLGTKSQKGSLSEAGAFYNVKTLSGDAHRAAYDIALTALLAEKILENHGLICLDKDIEKLDCVQSKQRYQHYLKTLNKKA